MVPGGDVKGPQVATVNSCNPKLKEATGINYGPYSPGPRRIAEDIAKLAEVLKRPPWKAPGV